MSFPKAKLKRFNEISVFSSPFTKDAKEPKCPGSAKKEKEKDKAVDKDCKSVTSGTTTTCDMESVKSSKYRLFRTPSLPKRLKFRSTTEASAKPKEEPFPFPLPAAIRQKEALEAAQIEIKNKTETITECHSVIEELKNENHRLESLNTELRSQKRKLKDDLAEMEKDIGCLRRGNDLLQGIAQGSLDKITELERDRNEMVQDYESAIAEMKRIHQLSSIEITHVTNELNFYKREVESFNVSLKECEIKMGMLMDDNSRLQSEMEQVRKQADEDAFNYVKENQAFNQRTATVEEQLQRCLDELKRKEAHIAELEEEICEKQVDIDSERDEVRDEYMSRIEELEKMIEQRSNEINQLKQSSRDGVAVNNDRNELITYYEGELEKLRKEHAKELAHRDQINEEKVRISEIQYEEKVKGLEACLAAEKQNWSSELQQCQKIAESEIMQSEFEKRDLKAILDSANELLREKDEKITQLEAMIKHEEDTYTKVRSEVEAEVEELKQLNQQLMTEKHNYQITLNSTRSTVQILMERLKKSDTDVESLKADIDLMTLDKSNMEVELNSLKEQLIKVSEEKEEFKAALNILKASAEALQREMREKESIFERMMSSEEETLNTVHNLGKLFNDKVEENLSKYYDMYNDLRQKYEARESYIKDMKTLLDEFATGIEFARMELEAKDKRIVELEEENKTIKLENMTYKFRCESLEKYSEGKGNKGGKVPPPTPDLIEDANEDDCDTIVSTEVIQNIIQDLERNELKEQPANDRQRIDLLQEIVQGENEEIKYLKSKLGEMIQKLEKTEVNAKESIDKYSLLVSQQTSTSEDTTQLKNKLKEQQEMINELKDLMIAHTTTSHSCPSTPRKMNRSGRISINHTPKTPKNIYSSLVTGEGKENVSPAVVLSPKVAVLRTRNA